MNFTPASLWELTKLTVRNPRTASSLVKAANVPLEVSIMMIVLAGVISGGLSGLVNHVLGAPPIVVQLADGRIITYEQGGPFVLGIVAVSVGLALAFAIYYIGKRMRGKGSLADIFAVVAVLQIIVTMIFIGEAFARLVVPVLGFGLTIFGLYVTFRGIGHAVNVGHDYNSLSKSAGVIVLSFILALIGVGILLTLLGIVPQGVIGIAPEGVVE